MSAETHAADELHARARNVAGLLRLPFRRRAWRGLQGNWQGIGTGSSLDFQDHRPYAPGDDPRYINWQAFARTGHYSMKLYRQEVSPAVDLVIDVSPSMFLGDAKAARTSELFYFCLESSLQTGASVRLHRMAGNELQPLAIDTALRHQWRVDDAAPADPGVLHEAPWRHGSMRILISDLLWPGEQQAIVNALGSSNATGLIFAPYSHEEAQPEWLGNFEMEDCETGMQRAQRVDADVLERYRAAYARHFEMWDSESLRHRVLLARVPAEPELAEALRAHAADIGAVEWA